MGITIPRPPPMGGEVINTFVDYLHALCFQIIGKSRALLGYILFIISALLGYYLFIISALLGYILFIISALLGYILFIISALLGYTQYIIYFIFYFACQHYWGMVLHILFSYNVRTHFWMGPH